MTSAVEHRVRCSGESFSHEASRVRIDPMPDHPDDGIASQPPPLARPT